MTVFIPKSLLSESAADAYARLMRVRDRLSSVQGQLKTGDFAHQKFMQDSRLEDLTVAAESGRDAVAQRLLERYRSKMAEWDSVQGKTWKSLETEIATLEAEQEQLEGYLSDYVGLRVEVA